MNTRVHWINQHTCIYTHVNIMLWYNFHSLSHLSFWLTHKSIQKIINLLNDLLHTVLNYWTILLNYIGSIGTVTLVNIYMLSIATGHKIYDKIATIITRATLGYKSNHRAVGQVWSYIGRDESLQKPCPIFNFKDMLCSVHCHMPCIHPCVHV